MQWDQIDDFFLQHKRKVKGIPEPSDAENQTIGGGAVSVRGHSQIKNPRLFSGRVGVGSGIFFIYIVLIM